MTVKSDYNYPLAPSTTSVDALSLHVNVLPASYFPVIIHATENLMLLGKIYFLLL